MRLLMLLISCMACLVNATAQNTVEIKKKINDIKKSDSYIYAEATASSKEEAKEIAEEILYEEINEWAAQKRKYQQKTNVVINKKNSYWSSYDLPRGNMFRSFLFVKKSDIIALDDSEVVGGLSKDIVELKSSVTPVFPDVVLQISKCKNYDELYARLTKLKSEGKVKYFARYASLPNPDDFYLAIYDRSGAVVAVLTNDEQRLNIQTGEPDSVGNYKGLGALGFSLSDTK